MTRGSTRRTRTVAAGAVAALALVVGVGSSAGAKPKPPVIKDGSEVEVQILALNDFHGNLLPPGGSGGRVGTTLAGGAAYLATHIQNLEATNANSIVVSAGDLIGASPILSALFHDEPTIEAMNEIGLDLNAVGNHEFDEGATELLRMANGGCHPTDGCQDGTPFGGADFDFLAANVVNTSTGETLFAPYAIRNFNGARVAFIGMTLEGTPLIVSAAGIQGLEFRDEADTVNALIPVLREQDVEAIVVLVHEGGSPSALDINGCSGVSGAIVDVVNRLDPEVDLVVSGHTHQPYNCVFNGIPTTSAFSFGRLVTDIDMRVDRATHDVSRLTINNRIVTRDVPQNQAILDLIARYDVVAAPIANRPIGHITAELSNAGQPDGEQVMGDVIADAQLAATDGPPPQGGAVVAFMNPGGVRAGLTFPSSPAGEGDGVVTFGEAFTVQPFGNILQTLTLTGAQIDLMLEQQFCGVNSPRLTPTPGFFKVLLPSAGFSYTWDFAVADSMANVVCATDPALGAVNPANVTVNGAPLDLNASYRVTVNNFLADGGDGFFVLRNGTDRVGGLEDLQAFEAYITAAEPTGISPPPLTRITRVN
jgi:5'-nucleotidase